MTTRQLVLMLVLQLLVAFNAGIFFYGWRCSHAISIQLVMRFGFQQFVCGGWLP